MADSYQAFTSNVPGVDLSLLILYDGYRQNLAAALLAIAKSEKAPLELSPSCASMDSKVHWPRLACMLSSL